MHVKKTGSSQRTAKRYLAQISSLLVIPLLQTFAPSSHAMNDSLRNGSSLDQDDGQTESSLPDSPVSIDRPVSIDMPDGSLSDAPQEVVPNENSGPFSDAESRGLWSNIVSDGFRWTDFTIQTIELYGTAMDSGARDVTSFCPNYNHLSKARRINFWAILISGITQYESQFRPTMRYREPTMGVDPITKQHVYSEGLMQLSYQDVTANPFCDEFNWRADSRLAPTDPRRSILDPYKNLRCGIRILNHQIEKYKAISFRKGQYWATLKPGSNAVTQIRKSTNQIPFCKR